MAKINVCAEIEHLEDICRTGNLKTIIFSFYYQDVEYKCFYCSGGDVITTAPEGYNIGLNLPITDNILDNYFSDDNYNKLKQIHPLLSTGIFCDRILKRISELTLDDVQTVTNTSVRHICSNLVRNTQDEKIFFLCWSRHFNGDEVSEDNLLKTLAFFGSEIYNICKNNNISSRWKSTPTKQSLEFLNRDKAKEKVINL